jgi:hypothetical protein
MDHGISHGLADRERDVLGGGTDLPCEWDQRMPSPGDAGRVGRELELDVIPAGFGTHSGDA